MSAEVVFVSIILSGMGGSFEIVGSWRKREYSFNGLLELKPNFESEIFGYSFEIVTKLVPKSILP